MLTRGDGAVLVANAAAARLFGVESPDVLQTRPMTDFYFDPAERRALAVEVAQDRSLTTREVCFRRADGRPLWTLANISLLEDSPAGPIYQSTLFDITDRKRAEDDVRLRDRAIQAAPQGILITDPDQPDNPIVYASPGFERLTGLSGRGGRRPQLPVPPGQGHGPGGGRAGPARRSGRRNRARSSC